MDNINENNTYNRLDFEVIKLNTVYKRFIMFLTEAKKVMTEIGILKCCKLVEQFNENEDFIKVVKNSSSEGKEYLYNDKILVDLYNTTNKSLLHSLKYNEIKKNTNSKLIEESILENEERINTSILNNKKMISLIRYNSEIYYFNNIHKLDDETKYDIDEILDRYEIENKTHLDLYYDYVGKSGIEYLSIRLQEKTNITSLNLELNDITNIEMEYLSDTLRYLTNLTELSFAYNKINSDGIKDLCCSFDCLKELKILDLYGNTICDEGLIILSKHFCFISNLVHLDISECSIGNKGVNEMCLYFSDIKSLENLYICKNDINDESMSSIVENCSILESLSVIDLRYNSIEVKVENIEKIKEIHPNHQIHVLI